VRLYSALSCLWPLTAPQTSSQTAFMKIMTRTETTALIWLRNMLCRHDFLLYFPPCGALHAPSVALSSCRFVLLLSSHPFKLPCTIHTRFVPYIPAYIVICSTHRRSTLTIFYNVIGFSVSNVQKTLETVAHARVSPTRSVIGLPIYGHSAPYRFFILHNTLNAANLNPTCTSSVRLPPFLFCHPVSFAPFL
jgi:hypothetical protein